MNEITIIVIGVICILIVGGVMGWFFAKRKFKRKMALLDTQIDTPETRDHIKEQLDEQEKVTDAREVRENDRRRAIFRGYGDRDLQPVEPTRRKPTVKGTEPTNAKPVGQHIDSATDVGSSELPDTELGEVGENNQPVGEPTRDVEEDEQESDWSR